MEADLAGEAVRMESQLTRPHDQIRSWDWLEAASTLTASKHPEREEKAHQSQKGEKQEAKEGETSQTCSSPAGSRCFHPSSTATGASAARTDTGCSADRGCATPSPQPTGRSGRAAARHIRHTSLAPGWTQLLEPEPDRRIQCQ